MSGRTVFQFALTGLLAALFTNPGLAQYDPQEESPPELLPMPREKTNTVGKAENPIVPASGTVPLPLVVPPPPPLCAFDRPFMLVPVVPGNLQASPAGCGINSGLGLSGNITINERNFDLFFYGSYEPLLYSKIGPLWGAPKCERVQSNGPQTIPALPQNLNDPAGQLTFENHDGHLSYRWITPEMVQAMKGVGQSPPYPVLGLTTIRWDEIDGGWWMETIRVPQPRKINTPDGPHGECGNALCAQLVTGTDSVKAIPFDPTFQAAEVEGLKAKDNHELCCQTPSISTAQCCTGDKLAGTWVREMDGMRVAVTVGGDELKICLSQNFEGNTMCATLTADHTLTKEGLVHGAITGADVEVKLDQKTLDLPRGELEARMPQNLISVQTLVDCPFSFRTRMTSAGLMVSSLKMGIAGDDIKEMLPLLCGMYKFSKDSNLPPLKPRKIQIGQSESTDRAMARVFIEALTSKQPTGTTQQKLPLDDQPTVLMIVPRSVTGISGSSTPPAFPSYAPGYAPSTPPVLRPMLTPTLPCLPPPMDCPQKCEPKTACELRITIPPLGSGVNRADSCINQDKKQLLHFSTGYFGSDFYSAIPVDKRAPTVPAPVVPPACPVPSPQTYAAPPKPVNVPGPEIDLIADAFGQMLSPQPSPTVLVAPAQVVLPCPVQATMPQMCMALPPATAAMPTCNSLFGTWVRVVGPTVYAIRVTPDHMTITATSAAEVDDEKVVNESNIMTLDYHLMQDGKTAVGLITSFDIRLDGEMLWASEFTAFAEGLSKLQKSLCDKPFAMSIRCLGDALVIGNVRLPDVEPVEFWMPMTVLGGRYVPAGEKPLPKPKAVKAQPSSPLGIPMPPQFYSPGYPAGAIAPSMVMPTTPPNLPPGNWGLPVVPYCTPGDLGAIQGAPIPAYRTGGNPIQTPMPIWPYPMSGCGGIMPPQSTMPPVCMPPMMRSPGMDCPAINPLPQLNAPAPRPMLPPDPLPEPDNQSLVVPTRIERSK